MYTYTCIYLYTLFYAQHEDGSEELKHVAGSCIPKFNKRCVRDILVLFNIFSGSAAFYPRGSLIIHDNAPLLVGLLRTSDQLVAETCT
jgi:hypothetical protein